MTCHTVIWSHNATLHRPSRTSPTIHTHDVNSLLSFLVSQSYSSFQARSGSNSAFWIYRLTFCTNSNSNTWLVSQIICDINFGVPTPILYMWSPHPPQEILHPPPLQCLGNVVPPCQISRILRHPHYEIKINDAMPVCVFNFHLLFHHTIWIKFCFITQ